MFRRRVPFTTILTAIFVLVGVASAFLLFKELNRSAYSNAPSGATLRAVEETEWGRKIKLDGKSYIQKEGLTTILLLGIDDSKEPDPLSIGTYYRSDALVLLILNDKSETVQTLSVSRDTITDVAMYDTKGDYIQSGKMQINMQYAFGDSPRRACYLTKKTVSELICGRKIDGCIAVTMSGIPTIGDLLGGLTLTMDEDYSYIDARYTQGATVTLNGEDLNRFLRFRDTDETGSNEARVARQDWLMRKLFDAISSSSRSELAETILDEAAEYIETDLDADTISKITEYRMESEGLKIPGEVRTGDLHDEFYVDQEALQELLLTLFYDPAA